MEAMDIQAVESKLSDVTVTAIPMSGKNVHKDVGHGGNSHATISTVPASSPPSASKDKDNGTSKYAQLLAVIEEMGKEVPMEEIDVRDFKTKLRWNTGYSADSVEFCPVEGYREALVCGTYQLEQKDEGVDKAAKQKRLGKIYLFLVNKDTVELSPVQTVDTAGVLDQKWCYHVFQDRAILAVVTSEGKIELYKLSNEEGYKLELWVAHVVADDVLALSVDWSSNKMFADEHRLVVSDSSGHVRAYKLVDDGLQEIGAWKAHEYEAWISAFNYWNQDVFYSGGDDCLLKSYDVRVGEAPVIVNRSHEAGVTAVRSNVDIEHQMLTGSYDEKVRLWDARNLKRCLSETDVKGGVWRIKWDPVINDRVKHKKKILVACMYGGFRLVNIRKDKINVICEYLEHESIAYGVDWNYDEDHTLVATCSFYDCKLHISNIIIDVNKSIDVNFAHLRRELERVRAAQEAGTPLTTQDCAPV